MTLWWSFVSSLEATVGLPGAMLGHAAKSCPARRMKLGALKANTANSARSSLIESTFQAGQRDPAYEVLLEHEE